MHSMLDIASRATASMSGRSSTQRSDLIGAAGHVISKSCGVNATHSSTTVQRHALAVMKWNCRMRARHRTIASLPPRQLLPVALGRRSCTFHQPQQGQQHHHLYHCHRRHRCHCRQWCATVVILGQARHHHRCLHSRPLATTIQRDVHCIQNITYPASQRRHSLLRLRCRHGRQAESSAFTSMIDCMESLRSQVGLHECCRHAPTAAVGFATIFYC